MRITKSDLKTLFNRLVKALNKTHDKGGYQGMVLEYIGCYGGYLIVEYDQLLGENHPFGSVRRNAKEMYLSMRMACEALEMIKTN